MLTKFRPTRTLMIPAIIAIALTSCKDDDPKEKTVDDTLTASISNSTLIFNTEGRWSGWDKKEDIKLFPEANSSFDPTEIAKIQFVFSHFYEGYPYGFTASKEGGNQNYPGEMLNHQFTVIPGDGYVSDDLIPSYGTTPFIVGNWDAYAESQNPGYQNRSCLITMNQMSTSGTRVNIEFEPASVMVTNTCYAYYSMLDGDSFAKKFGKGDYLKLIAHGVKTDNSEKTLEFYLADCRGNYRSKWLVKNWRKFNLTKLGQVKAIYFTMESSDNSQFGMNTPAYFAISNFEVVNKYLHINVD